MFVLSCRHRTGLAILLSIFSLSASADIVETTDGARLVGLIQKVTPGSVIIDTQFAGKVTIDRRAVTNLQTESAVTTKLIDGTVVTGRTSIDADGRWHIANDTLEMRAVPDKVQAVWLPAATPPPEAGYPQPRKWAWQVGADVNGREGNSQERGITVGATATLAGKNDELKLYTSVDKVEQGGTDTADEVIAGASYKSWSADPWGWYVRGEVERDEFENVDLRTTLAGGISLRVWNAPDHRLVLQAGAGYRHQSFQVGGTESSPTIDLGVEHMWVINDWLKMNNAFSFSPAINDFADYLARHDSSLEMPIGSGPWALQLGLRNDYNSSPDAGRRNLDTEYYSRLLLKFQ